MNFVLKNPNLNKIKIYFWAGGGEGWLGEG